VSCLCTLGLLPTKPLTAKAVQLTPTTWITNSIKLFADDAKIWRKIITDNDSESLQEDLNKLITWSQTWLLKFHPEKCKVMHIGHEINTGYTRILS